MALFTKNNRIVLLKQWHCFEKTTALFLEYNRIVLSYKSRLNFSNPYLVSFKLDLQRKRLDLFGFLKDYKLKIFGLEIDIKKFIIK